jgi:hypothetical protein
MASEAPEPVFQPRAALEALVERGIRFVVVGAYAAQLLEIGGILTRDLDIAPALDRENLDRLAELLAEFGATVRIENHRVGPVELPSDGGLIAKAPILNLHLPGIGDLDVIHEAAAATDRRGPLNFEYLATRATKVRLRGGTKVLVMSEADWIEAKSSPPLRERDRLHLDAHERWRGTRSE